MQLEMLFRIRSCVLSLTSIHEWGRGSGLIPITPKKNSHLSGGWDSLYKLNTRQLKAQCERGREEGRGGWHGERFRWRCASGREKI